MKTKLFALLAVASVVGAAVGINAGCYGTPANACFAAQGGHLVRYYPQAGTPTTGPCSPDPATGNPNLYSETVGVATYLGAPNGSGPDGGGGTFNGVEYYHPDYTHLTIALQSTTLAAANQAPGSPGDPVNSPISFATYGPLPTDAGICDTGTFSHTEQNIPSYTVPLMDGGTQSIPAFDVVYAWTNFNMVSTTSVQGTQWTATLTYTDKANNCSGTYTAIGLSPAIFCGNADGTPNNLICNPNNNLDAGLLASGIDPLFPVYCNPNILMCTLVDNGGATAPTIPDVSPGWFNNAPWLQDAGS